MPVGMQVLQLYAASNGWLDAYPVSAVIRYLKEMERFFSTRHADIEKEIVTKGQIDDATKTKIDVALGELKAQFVV
jgi:F-type H+-transporting ATPase subunit alpha